MKRPALFLSLFLLACAFLTGCAHVNPATGVPDRAYRGVIYAPAGSEERMRPLALDLYVPQRKDPRSGLAMALETPPPLVVWFHGGGWRYGHRRLYFLTRDLTEHGFAVATVSYRLSWGAKWPAQAQDVLAATEYLKTHGAEFGYDGSRMGLAGGSAGGHLAAYAGVTLEHPAISAVLALYPPTDLVIMGKPHMAKGDPNLISDLLGGKMGEPRIQALARAASPVNHVDTSDPPFLFIHGAEDPTVPVAQSKLLDQRLRAAGVESRIIVVPDADHGFSLDRAQLAEAAAFFQRHLAANPPPPRSPQAAGSAR